MIEQLSIKEILEKYTLLVPEIQREYVWGASSNIDKVIKFVETLDYDLGTKNVSNIGFLYSYTYNKEYNYIIDGQQRITTIALLLYVLACKEEKEKFDQAMNVKEPVMRFSYSVRTQTERFMKDLFGTVCCTEKEIVNQKWFISSYLKDTSIMSMVNAVDALNSIVKKLPNLSFNSVMNYVKFWYFNVEQTSQGEELYITMNSRGQKLTKSEHLKPYLFQKWQKLHKDDRTDYGKKWDEWEEFFYGEMKTIAKGKNAMIDVSAVDKAIDEYLKIILELEDKKGVGKLPEKTDVIDLPCIEKYINALMNIEYKEEITDLFAKKEKDNEFKILKAIVAERLKESRYDGDARRIKSVFENVVLRRGYTPKHDETLSFLNAFSHSQLSFYDFVIENAELCINVLDEHEIDKIRIYKRFNDSSVEEDLHDAETMEVWSGNISPILKWACADGTIETFDFEQFKRYDKQFRALYANDKLYTEDMDIVRRALLTQSLNDYPRYFRGTTNMSFAYYADDWKKLIKSNVEQFKNFFDRLNEGIGLEKMIDDYSDENDYSEFVHVPELLKYCTLKNIQYWHNAWHLVKRERTSGDFANIHAYKYYIENRSKCPEKWGVNFYPRYATCVYYAFGGNFANGVSIDLIWNVGSDHDEMQIRYFLKENGNNCPSKEPRFFESIAKNLSYQKGEDDRYYKNFPMPDDEREMFEIMDEEKTKLMREIENNINS